MLASLYVVSSATDVFSLPPSSLKPLSHSHWAAYFHQASVGSHFNYHILSSLAGKFISENPSDNKVNHHATILCRVSSINTIMQPLRIILFTINVRSPVQSPFCYQAFIRDSCNVFELLFSFQTSQALTEAYQCNNLVWTGLTGCQENFCCC